MLSIIRIAYRIKIAERFNKQQIKTLRRKRLNKLLKHVLKRSKFYKDYYSEYGITIDKIDSVALKDIPTINKEIMMENFDDLVCDSRIKRKDVEHFIYNPSTVGKKYRGSYRVMHTSGSTGSTGIFVYGPKDWAVPKAITALRVLKPEFHLGRTRYAFIVATGGHYGGVTLCQEAPRLFYNILPLSIGAPLDEITREIDKFQPNLLVGYASGVHLLAQQQVDGYLNIKPSRVICSGDPLTHKMRHNIREAFGVEPIDFYGACESIVLGANCDTYNSFHLYDDWHCFELADSGGQSGISGYQRNLILTNLYNYTQPLIRYHMSDEIVLDDRQCPCGWPFIQLNDFAGRSEEILCFSTPDGNREYIHPSAIGEFFVPGLRKFQLIQTQPNNLLMRIVVEGDNKQIVSRVNTEMNRILQGKRLEGIVRFETQVAKEIENDPETGKFRLIVPYI